MSSRGGGESPNTALAAAITAAGRDLTTYGAELDLLSQTLQRKVLQAFRAARVSEADLGAGTGYGYGDRGRDAVERVFAAAMDAGAALVRSQVVSGTHALAVALFGILRPGDKILSATGAPYDTLRPVIGPGPMSLHEMGVSYVQVDPWAQGGVRIDLASLEEALRRETPRAVLIQRSRGYTLRRSLSQPDLAPLIALVKRVSPESIVVVDNCYAEFVEPLEPTAYGADLLCGSLIKNPGGGIAPTGGYVAGREDLVERAAHRLYAPGLGPAVGPGLVPARLLLQGLFLAPGAVASALKGAVYASSLFAALGFGVDPLPSDRRGDIIQAIALGRRDLVEVFCRAIQGHSPVDSEARPEFAPMPGYDHDVIMAAGTFVQGASLELSADAPDRPPHWVFLQGGLGVGYAMAAAEAAAAAVLAAKGS